MAWGLILLVVAGCGKSSKTGKSATAKSASSTSTDTRTGGAATDDPAAGSPIISPAGPKPGLNAEERQVFYGTPMGNAVLPLDWLRAMKSKTTGQPFTDNLERFGLVTNEENPSGLPIGLALEEPVGVGDVVGKWVGVNCAACHTSQITYQGKLVRVDGGASLFNLDAFYREMFQSLEETLNVEQPEKLVAFLSDLVNLKGSYLDEPGNEGRKEKLQRIVLVLQKFAEFKADDLGPLEKSFRSKMKSLAADVMGKSAEETAAQNISGLLAGLEARGAEAKDELRTRLLTPFEGDVKSLVADVKSGTAQEGGPLGPLASLAEHELAEHFEHFLTDAGLLKARLEYLRTLKEINDTMQGTNPGPGRIDAFVNARDLIWPKQMIPATSPISFPRIWNLETFDWLHWDADTTSVTQRNFGQAIGMGAVRLADGRSTVLPKNLAQLQELAEKLTQPKWPEQAFGKIDTQKFAAGATLFKKYCAECHPTDPDANPTYRTPWETVRTDPNRLNNVDPNYSDPNKPKFSTLVDGKPFYAALKEALAVIVEKSYEQWNIDEAGARRLEGKVNGQPRPFPPLWQDGSDFKRDYVSRPLAGVWATAPYLHNGSVPTLDDLLQPKSNRPVKFYVGYREFDPVHVGYASRGDEAKKRGFEFDATQPGNDNGGHEGEAFGTELSDSDRAALLEYLKTL
jgi:mono/diheme cytochrome c family protein